MTVMTQPEAAAEQPVPRRQVRAQVFPEPLEVLPGDLVSLLEPTQQLEILTTDLIRTQRRMSRRTRKVMSRLAAARDKK